MKSLSPWGRLPAASEGLSWQQRRRTVIRMGATLSAFLIMAAIAAAGLSSCGKSDKGAEVETSASPKSAVAGLRKAAIMSNFPCKDSSDCTFTNFANTPKSAGDCACLAACTPFVVNVAEKGRREAANKEFCNERVMSKDKCPAPPCGFIEFDDFRCVEGKCTGYALVD